MKALLMVFLLAAGLLPLSGKAGPAGPPVAGSVVDTLPAPAEFRRMDLLPGGRSVAEEPELSASLPPLLKPFRYVRVEGQKADVSPLFLEKRRKNRACRSGWLRLAQSLESLDAF